MQPAVADLNPARVRDSRIPLSAAVQQQQHQQQQQQPAAPRQKVRTRVSLPKQPEEITLDEGFEPGPPKFTLSSDEDIQRFRDANRFSPQAGQVSWLVYTGHFIRYTMYDLVLPSKSHTLNILQYRVIGCVGLLLISSIFSSAVWFSRFTYSFKYLVLLS